jgi:hypothetical protein
MPTIIDGTTGVDQIQDGTVTVNKIAAGAVTETKLADGDGSWQTISTTPTTSQVLAATAGASAGAVGTYAFAASSTEIALNTTRTNFGGTIAGSSLLPVGVAAANANFGLGSALSGTWRCVGIERNGNTSVSRNVATMWLRIS